MFAVPGWSVSSELLKTQKPEGKKSAPNGSATGEASTSKPDKKRKRNGATGKTKVHALDVSNMEELWGTVIEGKEKSKGKTNGEKRQKISQDADTAKKAPVDETVGSEPTSKKPKTKATKKGEELEDVEGKVSEDVTAQSVAEVEDAAPKEKFKKGKTMKDKKREKKAKLKAIADGTLPATETSETPSAPIPTPVAQPPKATLTPLQASMRQKLISARFRHLNQTLYTTPSKHSLSLFQENPEMFQEYHEGFRRQVEVWPENPVDGYSAQIILRGKIKGPQRGRPLDRSPTAIAPLPRTEGTCTIADLGCGDAALSTSLQPHLKKLNLKVHSFDLQSPSPLVTKADIANLSLKDGSVDIAIFCLALMGTNWVDFIEEAFRILRWKGELWIAEIKSRFGRVSNSKVVSHSVGNKKRQPLDKKAKKAFDEAADDEVAAVEVDGQDDRGAETDVSAFVEVLRKRGFVLKGEGQGGETTSVDLRNKMFVRMWFVKGATPIKGKGVPLPKGGEEFAPKETWKKKGKFIEEAEEETHISSEAGVLKPCVYKLR